MLIAWAVLQCVYLGFGSLLAPALICRLLQSEAALSALGNPALALAVALGGLVLWPVLLAVAMGDAR